LLDREGQSVPQATFRMFSETGWCDLSTTDLFSKKTVVAFAIPGAFTLPHSPIQLLGYDKYAETFRKNGVDEIFCISVNDPFSLAAWANEEQSRQVRFIPDTNGDFTREIGMMVNLWDKGMGKRSWRYSMLVKNEIIEKMFVEADGFETMPTVSNAETMLSYINPEIVKPEKTAVLMQMWRTVFSD